MRCSHSFLILSQLARASRFDGGGGGYNRLIFRTIDNNERFVLLLLSNIGSKTHSEADSVYGMRGFIILFRAIVFINL